MAPLGERTLHRYKRQIEDHCGVERRGREHCPRRHHRARSHRQGGDWASQPGHRHGPPRCRLPALTHALEDARRSRKPDSATLRRRPRGMDWLETLEALQSLSVSDQAACEVVEYVMKLRTAVTVRAGDRTGTELTEAVGKETAELVEEPRQTGDQDHWNTVISPTLLESDSQICLPGGPAALN